MARTIPENCPFPWGSAPWCNTWFLEPTRIFIQNGTSIGSTVFAQHTIVSHYFTINRYILPPKLPLPIGGLGSPSNTWYLGLTRVINKTASQLVQPFLYGSQMLCCTMHCQQEIRSVEHGICTIAEYTSPWQHCAHSNRIPCPLFWWCRDVHLLLKNIKWILKSH